jgi:predicted lipoprotein with Yx(FWY)xxD motif
MNFVPIIISSAVAILAGLGMWGFLGTGFFISIPQVGGVNAELSSQDQGNIKLTETVSPHVFIMNDDELGSYLVSPQGRALYTTTKDSCVNKCLEAWPPYVASGDFASKGDLSAILVEDLGRVQFSWKGKLLYYYVNDERVGDTNGKDVAGVWFLARP